MTMIESILTELSIVQVQQFYILMLPIMVSDIAINTAHPFWTVTGKHYGYYTMFIFKFTI